MLKPKYLAVLMFLFVVTIAILFVLANLENEERKLKNNGISVMGRVIEIAQFPRGDGLWVYYEFSVRNHSMRNKMRIFIPKEKIQEVQHVLVNHLFPAIVDSADYSVSVMLLNRNDLQVYKIHCPDSTIALIDELQSFR